MSVTLRYLSPPQIAAQYRVRASKVIGWIVRGELRGIDVSDHPGVGRARWMVSPADLAVFENRRVASPVTRISRRRKKKATNFVKYF